MNNAILLTLVLALITASFTITIQPIKADSHTISVTSSNQLVNAIYGAADGTTIFVNKGTYEIPEDQTLVITKAIALTGEDADNTIISIHPAWVPTGGYHLANGGIEPDYGYNPAIEIQGSDIEISGLTLSSDGGNILATGSRIQIRNCKIATYLLANGRHQNISQNTITEGIGCYGSFNNIAGNSIIGYGVIVSGDSNEIQGNNITDCNTETAGCGIRLDAGGHTVFNNIIKNCNHAVSILGERSSNSIYANTVINNDGGLEIFGQGSNNAFHDNYVANNRYGVLLSYTFMMSPGENNTVYHNNFVDNTEQINSESTYYGDYGSAVSIYPTGNYDNGREGNYWSDYAGTDANNDGIGDSPYVVDAIRKDHYPLMYPWGAPYVSVFGLENATYSGSVSLNFTVNKPTSWIGYSLDGSENVTITGNTTLTGLSSGLHNVTVYARDEFGNTGASEIITFTVEEPGPFPTALVAAASGASAAIIGIGLLIYLKKRKR
jgi:hypothetical protein